MSQWIILVFIAEFIALAVVAGIARQDGLALYGIGGAILNVGVLLMGRGI